MGKPRVVILGAGPAGLAAAYRLSRRGIAQVTVLEKGETAGGTAGSFDLAGLRVDYGSHRLHPSCDPELLRDLRSLLDGDLLDRPRHGRIRLRGRWVHFPLKPADLALKLTPGFALGVGFDLARKLLPRRTASSASHSFASVLEATLGQTICRDFYFPYSRKLWGLEPDELSPNQARRRVSANSLGKMARKALGTVPGLKPKGSNRFYYPRYGFGQISEAFYKAALESGADIQLAADLQSIDITPGAPRAVQYERDGQRRSLVADFVWSTIPITSLIRYLRPEPPQECLAAADSTDYRGMVLIYLVLDQERFSEYDAHYFPESDIPILRLSEPKNYGDGRGPRNVTVLCAELPCSPGDPEWDQGDEALGMLVCRALRKSGIPVRATVKQIVTRRLRHAYPVYKQGYEEDFDRVDRWLGQVDGLLTFGRQGLFAHDNTHHALLMGYAAAACLDDSGSFDRQRWQVYRHSFETHVVED